MVKTSSLYAGLGAAGLALAPIIAPAAGLPGVWRMAEEHVLGAPANFIVTARTEQDAAAAVFAARAEIERLDAVFNTRRSGVELFELNQSRAAVVSPELFEVVTLAERLRQVSGGAYNGALGEALDLWRKAAGAAPDAARLAAAVAAARTPPSLDPTSRHIALAPGTRLALDSIAKGYIVDMALKAGLAAAPVAGLAVDIGGDIACAGCAPSGLTWDIDIPDPALPAAMAPPLATAHLRNAAIATSGKGPRDFSVGAERISATLDPFTGQGARANLAASVIAPTTAEADGLATALLVMEPAAGLALAASWPGASARITAPDGQVFASESWRDWASAPAAAIGADALACQAQPGANGRWMPDWAVEIVYSAPQRAVSRREPDFRTPYMAMWITDKQNNPIRTLVLVGTRPEWQRDNYIWWNMYRDKATELVRLRSTSTQLSGAYPTYWPGYNDDWKFVGQGEYVLHVETSRERGRHTYRTVPLVLGTQRFTTSLPPTEEGGGMQLTYAKRD